MDHTLTPRHDPLWVPIVAPVVWASHFTICYVAAALACGRFASVSAAGTVRATVLLATIVSLLVIGAAFARGLRRHRYAGPVRPHDDDTPEDRDQFMAFTTVLLAGLSALATVAVALAMWWVPSCL